MDLTRLAAHSLAKRSSRRQLFKVLGATSLGAGLFLTRTGVSLGAVEGCIGCGGGPCNPCSSPRTLCENIGFPARPARREAAVPRVARPRASGSAASRADGSAVASAAPSASAPAAEAARATASPISRSPARLGCTPATSHACVRRRSRRSEPRALDGPDVCRSPQARRQVVQTPVLQVPRSELVGHRPLPDEDGRLAGRGRGLRRLRRRAVQPVRRSRPDLHERRLPLQDLPAGSRLSRGLPHLG